VAGFGDHAPGRPQDDHGDEHRQQRVDRHPAGHEDHDRSRHRGDRTEQVAENVEKSGADVQVVLVPGPQDQENANVYREPRDRDPQHQAAEHLNRLVEPPHRFEHDGSRDRKKRDAVDERHEHRKPVEAIGATPIRRSTREPEPEPRERKAREIREHVAGIGEQGERAGQHAARDLREHEPGGEQARNRDAPLVHGVRMTRVGMALVVVMGRVRVVFVHGSAWLASEF
jgi:hypothetical protein